MSYAVRLYPIKCLAKSCNPEMTASFYTASKRPISLFFVTALLAGAEAMAAATHRLYQLATEANVDSEFGRYPSFLETPSLTGPVDLSEVVRESISPPFPSRVTFKLELPSSAFLSLDVALVVVQRVERARVEFAVEISAGDQAPARVFAETLELRDANLWHPRQIDLTDWSGRRVRLSLVTRPARGEGTVLWADRVQTVWGDATIASRRWKHALGVLSGCWARIESWGRDQAGQLGLEPDQQTSLAQFVMSLILGGVLTFYVRGLYLRFSTSAGGTETFANMFLVLTLTTMFVIYVVQSSLALSLGLIGALSIVRFRTAIKSPEELVYAFLCVAIGIALGANRLLLCTISVVVISVFIFFTSRSGGKTRSRQWLLTVSGEPGHFFSDKGAIALDALTRFDGAATIQRLDHDENQVQLRVVVTMKEAEASVMLSKMRERLPGLRVSYVDVDELL